MYRADVFLPVNCDAMIHYYMCSVAAFNEKGEGPMSRQLKTYLPCDFTSEFKLKKSIHGPVLVHQRISLVFAIFLCSLSVIF